ncbi:unnamed protein product [Euphydryas editha]|uniref:Uncharacterized protein n=1 Tax=Euphydryas editha TaxID=104508 RepID=A0AAU9U105_EUPED|nr:unnamed protein product [Euphydryas editha]
MNKSKIPSPARSQGVISTPRKHTPRRSRSVCSAKSNTSVRLTSVITDPFHLSPMPNRRSVLNDDTDIEIPGRKSWWKKLGENTRDMMQVLSTKDIAEVNNVAEEFDVEILSQEKMNYSIDLPESSDGGSINSIVIPRRKLFTQKENQAQKKFEHLIDNRETLAELQKSHFDHEKEIDIGPKNLLNKAPKPRIKPVFPAELLNISSKTVNKTKELPASKVKGQVRNLFSNRLGTKRKNIFADFIVSESEDEIPDIQPKVFGFQKNTQKRRESSASRGLGHSPTSSIDLELDDWKHLPSSTLVENQLNEAATTPVKRARLSKLSEPKESEITNINTTVNKTRQSNKSASSKNKSKASTSKLKDKKDKEQLSASKAKEDLIISKNNQSLSSSSNVRLTRNKSKSMRESSLKEGDQTKLHSKSKNKSQSQLSPPMEVLVQERDKNTEQNNENNMEIDLIQNDVEKQTKNMAMADVPGDDDENFTLEYENDDEQVNETIVPDNTLKNKSNENNDLVDAVPETETSKQATIEEANEERSKIQINEDELKDPTAHFEKQKQDNKQRDHKTILTKNIDKQGNKSALNEKEVNRSQNKSRKSRNVTMDEVQQKTQNESQIEKEINISKDENVSNAIDNTDKEQNINERTPHNGSTQQNESTESNDKNEIQNETDESDEEIEQQNESIQSNYQNEINNENKQSDDEIEEQNESKHENENVDEIEVEEEETEENESETEEQIQQHESENINSDNQEQNDSESSEEEAEEQENEEQIQQDESENINSDNQEQNDSESSEEEEAEEQENEEMEVEEENASEEEKQNETESQESENVDSDDDLQNESNLSQNNEQIESDQEQSDVPENELIETSNHDTTLRNKIKNATNVKSPEAILNDKTNQIESFTTQGRNTSIRKTKSIIKNLTIKPSFAPVRESTGFSEGTRDSSAEGSGWDSHRTTRKTLRLTLGKDFTPRKSLRALVMEKSAKRHTNVNEVTTKIPQANSTELPAFDSYEEPAEINEMIEEPSEHEISARTKQTTLEMYLQKLKQENLEKKRKMEEEVRASLKVPTRDTFNPFKVPLKPVRRIKPIQNKRKTKQKESSVTALNMLHAEILEDMKYKPPKRFRPSNASWITKRLYKFLESKLEPKYDYKARVRAERFVEMLYGFTREVKRGPSEQAVDSLKKEMARLNFVKTHFDFYEFFHEFMPREVRVKVVPDIVNKLDLPRSGVFSDILQ